MKKLLIFMLALSMMPINSVFAGTLNNGSNVMRNVLSYKVSEDSSIVVKANGNNEGSIYAMAVSYEEGQMMAIDMIELFAGDEDTLTLQDWGQEVKLFALSTVYSPLCEEVEVWNENGIVLNTSELEFKLEEAKNLLKADYQISVNGSDVPMDKQWITAEMRTGLEDEVNSAEELFYNDEFETQEQIDTTVAILEKAIAAFQPAYGTSASAFDTSELESKLEEANNLLKGDYKISVDGSDVSSDTQWITIEMKTNLENAMYTAAELFYNAEFETQAQVNDAVEMLEEAIQAFRPAYGVSSVMDTSELESVMGQAEYLLGAGYQISADGSDVAADKQWVTAEMKNDLENAFYAAAEWFYNDEFETQEQIDATVAELEDAISAFKPAYGLL